jgi:integrase
MVASVLPVDLKQVGRHMSRPRSQQGELSETPPHRGKLPRGCYWSRWRLYIRRPDGTESVKRPSKIIHRALAEKMGFVLDYAGPLTKTDAWKVLGKLIGGSNAAPATFSAKTTFGELAREYLELNKPQWEAWTAENTENLIETHLAGGALGSRPVTELSEAELQRFLNQYVEKGSSSSLLSKILRYMRTVLNMAVDRKLIERSPARKLKARSRKRVCELNHTLDECDALIAQLSGRDRLITRLLAQLGLRSEELFVLRRDDVLVSALAIDEAIVRGRVKGTKTEESAAVMYVPPDLELELKHHLDTLTDDSPKAWLFPASRKEVALRPENFLKRVLKPAAIRAKIALSKNGEGKEVTGCNFQSLRRTSATLFGARAKDPRLTQAHLRHTDPRVTLKHYQKEIPAEVRAAALALETDLLAARRKREAEQGTAAKVN